MKQGRILFFILLSYNVYRPQAPLSPLLPGLQIPSPPDPLLLHFLKEGFIIQFDHQGRNKGQHPMSHPLNTEVTFRNMYGRIKDEGKGFPQLPPPAVLMELPIVVSDQSVGGLAYSRESSIA